MASKRMKAKASVNYRIEVVEGGWQDERSKRERGGYEWSGEGQGATICRLPVCWLLEWGLPACLPACVCMTL